MRTQVAIVGAGPAGMTLAHLLRRAGIDCVVIEARDRAYVEGRVRAGLLEQNTTDLLEEIGVGERMRREGLPHDGIRLRCAGETCDVDIAELTGRRVTIYGQQEVVKDLIDAWLEGGGELRFEAPASAVEGVDSERPGVRFALDGAEQLIECDFVAGCDGFHGICRTAIADHVRTLEHAYPFAWLGILAHAAPATDELIYAWHEHGFALYSMRSPSVSRLYLQVPPDEDPGDWSDDRVWSELQLRLAADGFSVNEGEIFDKGVTPMRSFVAEPMRHGRVFLCGDAAHIVPPTGAKGLNLAVNDVRLLADGLERFYGSGDASGLDSYSERALRRVWRAQDFSNHMTQLLHRLDGGPFDDGLQRSRLDYVFRSETARRSLAENYAGLPATADF
ncbi:MAG TPA: 4-hydroxybenzoate 3-monooxygenase [Solirubrobacteraceae bacterium]|nr:4-hydroxybenzoate 3-monooxygenase [Solirubrobacteraceae bacterium]